MKPSLSHPEQMSPKLPLRCVRKRSLADSIIGTDRNTMVTQPEEKPCRKIWKLPLKAVHRPLVSIQTPALRHCPPFASVCPWCGALGEVADGRRGRAPGTVWQPHFYDHQRRDKSTGARWRSKRWPNNLSYESRQWKKRARYFMISETPPHGRFISVRTIFTPSDFNKILNYKVNSLP